MSVLEASSAGVKDMADGSLRITIEFSPLQAKEAYALYGARGTPLAIAALKTGYAAAGGPLQPPKPKTGPLCLLACQWCANEEFWGWADVFNEESAKQFILAACEIESRKELDADPKAAANFETFIRKPYMRHQKEFA